jgi:hypothetical protein
MSLPVPWASQDELVSNVNADSAEQPLVEAESSNAEPALDEASTPSSASSNNVSTPSRLPTPSKTPVRIKEGPTQIPSPAVRGLVEDLVKLKVSTVDVPSAKEQFRCLGFEESEDDASVMKRGQRLVVEMMPFKALPRGEVVSMTLFSKHLETTRSRMTIADWKESAENTFTSLIHNARITIEEM